MGAHDYTTRDSNLFYGDMHVLKKSKYSYVVYLNVSFTGYYE